MNRQDRDSVHSTRHLPGLLWLTLMNWHGATSTAAPRSWCGACSSAGCLVGCGCFLFPPLTKSPSCSLDENICCNAQRLKSLLTGN